MKGGLHACLNKMSSLLASCSKVVLVHSMDSPDPKLTLRPHAGRVNSVTWNQNNKVLATGGDDGELILEHAESGQSLGQWQTPRVGINAVAFTSKR